jgi:sulfotransferase family protein
VEAVQPRLLFVGGLHRSGTSLLYRSLTLHPQIGGISGSGVPEDEGQHLQSVYRPARDHGGPGRFGFDADARLTESSPLVTAANRERLLTEWGRHWSGDVAVVAEKSPPNLIRMRFLQALFPEAAFVMMVRHPIAVACATRKWACSSYPSLIRHWILCHEIMAEDATRIDQLHVVHYEHFVREPGSETARILSQLGLGCAVESTPVDSQLNDRYFAAWRSGGSRLGRSIRDRGVLRYEAAVNRFGYSLIELDRLPPRSLLADPSATAMLRSGS